MINLEEKIEDENDPFNRDERGNIIGSPEDPIEVEKAFNVRKSIDKAFNIIRGES